MNLAPLHSCVLALVSVAPTGAVSAFDRPVGASHSMQATTVRAQESAQEVWRRIRSTDVPDGVLVRDSYVFSIGRALEPGAATGLLAERRRLDASLAATSQLLSVLLPEDEIARRVDSRLVPMLVEQLRALVPTAQIQGMQELEAAHRGDRWRVVLAVPLDDVMSARLELSDLRGPLREALEARTPWIDPSLVLELGIEELDELAWSALIERAAARHGAGLLDLGADSRSSVSGTLELDPARVETLDASSLWGLAAVRPGDPLVRSALAHRLRASGFVRVAARLAAVDPLASDRSLAVERPRTSVSLREELEVRSFRRLMTRPGLRAIVASGGVLPPVTVVSELRRSSIDDATWQGLLTAAPDPDSGLESLASVDGLEADPAGLLAAAIMLRAVGAPTAAHAFALRSMMLEPRPETLTVLLQATLDLGLADLAVRSLARWPDSAAALERDLVRSVVERRARTM